MAIVYRHIRLDKNEPFYIGIGKTQRRATSVKNRNKYWKNIVSKTDYTVEILFDDLSWEDACEKEMEFIKLYGRYDLGQGCLVNMTDGGEGLKNISDELRNRFSQIAKQRTFSDKTRKKMSISQSKPYSEKYSNYQSVLDQRKDKMIEFNKTYKPSEHTNKKISDTLKDRCISEEHRLKQKQSAINRWGNTELKKQVQLFLLNNPKSTEKSLMERFDITRSFLWRLKKQIKTHGNSITC